MKNKVELSGYALILTIVYTIIILCIIWILFSKDDTWVFIPFTAAIGIWYICALFYAPLAISANEKAVSVHRSLRIKGIPLSEIKSVKPCPPTMAERRILGSGGFLGYWGWFAERDLGKYFAYYGKASDCFLVELKSGRKYMLGCKDQQAMVSYINSLLCSGKSR